MSEFLASYDQHSEFGSGTIWADYINELNTWLQNIHSALEVEELHDDLMRLQGSAKVLRDVMRLPEIVMLLIADQARERTNDKDESDERD